MSEPTPTLRWGVEKRLEFIEFRLYWENTLNRSDLINFFGVSVPQSSKDLSLYQERAPGNMEYDKSKKQYVATEHFAPQFFAPDADRYLSQLRLIGENIETAETFWGNSLPEIDCMTMPRRRVDSKILRTILQAISNNRSVEFFYQSMNAEKIDPEWREISPHALGHDGLRWHIRAFCHQENKFKDFLLSRCLEIRNSGEALSSAGDDWKWNEKINLVLIPNPQLSKSQQSAIARDYCMKDSKLVLPIRKALLYYFEKRLRLDVAEALDNPQEAPVVIANVEEFDSALSEEKQ